ncbi:hypothetical protein EVAR_63628_1 [Eumeta japonica]|uniref:Uncharacterized protein n=1 Tax=Eumeta variegata TaxID=151549 RepID=A0A4C1ZTZ5_EUMVA|nr:hypothetical protein EVAR_63628_1 [Eumeta japonica]
MLHLFAKWVELARYHKIADDSSHLTLNAVLRQDVILKFSGAEVYTHTGYRICKSHQLTLWSRRHTAKSDGKLSNEACIIGFR